MGRSQRRELLGLAAITAVAALARFYYIGHQSFWLDEAFTVDVVTRPFGNMLSAISATESTPPLYYALAWLWVKLFGHGEAGLRALSAVIGTLTVPVAWCVGRELFGAARVGLVAAALVAVNPYFVWYSQEARAYSLLVLMGGLSLLATIRAVERRTRRSYAIWALVAALALCTHYFAAFLLVPEAIWLLWIARERAAWVAVSGVGIVAAVLAPLAIHQRDEGHTAFIAKLGLARRVIDLPKKLVSGELGTPTPLIGPLAGLVAAAAIAYALVATDRPWRRAEAVLLAVVAAAAILPLVLALGGADYLLPRNLIAMYVPLVVAVAAGLAAPGAGRVGLAGAAVVCVVALVVNAEVTSDPSLQRDDWRGTARALGAPSTARAVVVSPDFMAKPLRYYAGVIPDMPPAGAPVSEVDVIGSANRLSGFVQPRPPQGFHEVLRKSAPSYLLIRYVADAPIAVTPAGLQPARLGSDPAAILLQTPPARKDTAQ